MGSEEQDVFQNNLQNPEEPKINDASIIAEIDADNEKEFLTELKKKNKEFLIPNLSELERERIAGFIKSRFDSVQAKHKELEDKIDGYDEVFRMVRKPVIGGEDDLSNYRSALTTVSLETIHANYMNVFFTPKDIMRVLPTEEGDIPKVEKLSTFGNWSIDNELEIFNNIDRLFHNSSKVGETPYMVHWVKEYGEEIKREIVTNPANPDEPLFDPDTKEPIFQEVTVQKLVYNGPKMEVFSRKDYFQPNSAMMGKTPEWEMRRIRMTYDQFLREELQGKMYAGSHAEIKDWSGEDKVTAVEDFEGDAIPMGKLEQEFIEFYGRMRVKLIKTDKEDNATDFEELEDEFIAIVHIGSEVLCSLRRNKFPLKMRPIGMDFFIPDDEGRRKGIGIVDFMSGLQTAYDALYNQYIASTVKVNAPIMFFSPTGNWRNKQIKLRHGYGYPSSDPSGVKIFQFPPPDPSINLMLQLIQQWGQLLFGISSFKAGVESQIDPDAPAKKAQIVVAEGDVRLNAVIKRKIRTLQDIFKRWFLLYKENMPPNKFMRIAGSSEDNPFEFKKVSLSDFALNALPDFELTGNIQNANKALEANKKLGIYQLLVQNPLFAPVSKDGIQRLIGLSKWLIEGLDTSGLSRLIPDTPGEDVITPEEENARFLQGDTGEPKEGEDHLAHVRVHLQFASDPTLPEAVAQEAVRHAREHIKLLQQEVQQQAVLQQAGINPQQFPQEGGNGQAGGAPEGATRQAEGILQGQPGVEGPQGRV